MPAPRYREVSRLEGFSDAVFGFALTLLVVSLETPKDMAQLRVLLGGFLPFAVTFAMVCWIWYEHNAFFRRYGMQDAWTIFLNCVLLFVVLFYVYPLRFLATALIGQFFLPAAEVPRLTEGRFIMILYSAGVLAIFATFWLLHQHAWRRRSELDLSSPELVTLKYSMRAHLFSVCLAVLSFVLLFAINDPQYAGWVYALMGPLQAWNGWQARLAHQSLSPPKQPEREHKAHDHPHR